MQTVVDGIFGAWLVALTTAWVVHLMHDSKRWKRIEDLINRIESDVDELP